jgi:cytochrome bd-type quinol oxidase subunit 1
MEKNLQRAKKLKTLFLFSLLLPVFMILLDVLVITLDLPDDLHNIFAQWTLLFTLLSFLLVLVFLVIWIAALIANQAENKGRNWKSFFILSLFFPFIMWIVVSVMTTDQSQPISGTKKCPKCAEYVKKEATLCKHCGSEI